MGVQTLSALTTFAEQVLRQQHRCQLTVVRPAGEELFHLVVVGTLGHQIVQHQHPRLAFKLFVKILREPFHPLHFLGERCVEHRLPFSIAVHHPGEWLSEQILTLADQSCHPMGFARFARTYHLQVGGGLQTRIKPFHDQIQTTQRWGASIYSTKSLTTPPSMCLATAHRTLTKLTAFLTTKYARRTTHPMTHPSVVDSRGSWKRHHNVFQ